MTEDLAACFDDRDEDGRRVRSKERTVSQVQAINGKTLKTWDDYETGCLMTYRGGHHDPKMLDAFQHGMCTVFNLLRAEFKEAHECRKDPA